MMEWVQETEGIWTYLVLFLLAAAPWLEVFLVIPLGVGIGLNPLAVAITGFIGNWIPIILIVLFFKKLSEWRERRKARKRLKQATFNQVSYEQTSNDGSINLNETNEQEQQQEEQQGKKQQRARKLWEKYGIPGFSLLAPILVGTDIAMVLALAFGSPRRPLLIWMTISLLLWSIILTVLTIQGVNFIQQ